jgi:hypothetical protein
MMSVAMIQKIKRNLLSVTVLAFAMSFLVYAPPVAAADPPSCPERVLTFPAWYKGVIDTATCEVKIDSVLDLVKIPLNFIEILIQAVAYVATGFIVWGGFKYMKSQGDPGKISEAKSAIINAVTGLGIALLSVGIVEFIQGRFS